MLVTAVKHPWPQLVSHKGDRRITEGITIANLEIRPVEFDVLVDGRRAGLTQREYKLFSALAENPDVVMQRPAIYEIVWGGAMRHRDRSVDVVVRKIRGKLEIWAPDWRYIHTHFAIGYRFHPERIAAAEPEAVVIPDRRGKRGPGPDLAELRTA